MRFNERHKTIIRDLVNYDKTKLLADFLVDKVFIQEKDIIIFSVNIKDTKQTILFYPAHIQAPQNLFLDFIEVFQLFKRLEEENLIYFFPMNDNTPFEPICWRCRKFEQSSEMEIIINCDRGEYVTRGKMEWCDANGNVLYRSIKLDDNCFPIYNIIGSLVFVTPELQELVENNFITIVDQQLNEAKKQTRNSWIAIFIAIITTICSILIPAILSLISTNTHIDTHCACEDTTTPSCQTSEID